jgi:hypothetical protein
LDAARSGDVVHPSVFDRQARSPNSAGAYRPGGPIAVGEKHNCAVFASEPWNWTGIYFERGEYELDAHGEWLDQARPVGLGGTTGTEFGWPAL